MRTYVGLQKIDGSILETYEMVIIGFQVQDKLRRARFFQKSFLVADPSVKVIFELFFLTFSKVEVDFIERELTWKTYRVAEALRTTKKI